MDASGNATGKKQGVLSMVKEFAGKAYNKVKSTVEDGYGKVATFLGIGMIGGTATSANAATIVPSDYTLTDVITDIGVVFAVLLGVKGAMYGGRQVLSLFR